MSSDENCVETVNDRSIDGSQREKCLIVLSAPSVKNKYYSSKFNDIVDYMTNFANKVDGKDDVVILADKDTIPQFQVKLMSKILIEARIDDIWIRDFSPVIPTKQIKFEYNPSYLPNSVSKQIDKTFDKWFVENGLEYYRKSNLVIDGGNIVENPSATRVILTDRIFQDNPSLTKSTAKDILKQLLDVNEIAIIPEEPNDTTGHADGLVMWIDDDKILLIKTDPKIHSQILYQLKTSFPNIEIIEIENSIPNTTWKNFSSAHNCFVNSIVTDDYIYMPTFNDIYDSQLLDLFKLHTNKTIVPISAENIAMMGGSLRCLSWQIKNKNNHKILQLINK